MKKRIARHEAVYSDWRKKVLERDFYTCQKSDGTCKGKLSVHHIKPYKEFPNLAIDLNNGITLCGRHHMKEHSKDAFIRRQKMLEEIINTTKINLTI